MFKNGLLLFYLKNEFYDRKSGDQKQNSIKINFKK